MGKYTTRLPLDIKTGDPQNSHVPIYDEARGVWNTISSSSLLTSTVSASYALTASFVAGNVLSSSFATTASYVVGTVLSSSYALTASYAENTKVFPFTGSADISGSLSVRTNNVFISGANEPILTIRGNYPKINLMGLAGAGNSGSIYMNGSEVRVGGMSANTNLVFMAGGSPTWYIDSTNGDDLIPTLNDFSVYPNIGATTTRVKTIFTTNINSTNPISSSVSASYAATASFVSGVIPSSSYALTSSIATSASYVSAGAVGGTITSASYASTASVATSITFSVNTGSFTGSFIGILTGTGSWAQSASYALTSSFSTTASFAITSSTATSITFTPVTASYAISASRTVLAESVEVISGGSITGLGAYSGSFTGSFIGIHSGSTFGTASSAISSSFTTTASAATSITFAINTGSFTGSFIGTHSGSTFGTASWAQSSSIAISASYAVSSSRARSVDTVDIVSGGSITGLGAYSGSFTGSFIDIVATGLTVNGISSVQSTLEKVTVAATAPPATLNYNVLDQAVLFHSASSNNNWTLNFRGNASVPLNNVMASGQQLVTTLLVLNTATAYSSSAYQIDGTPITPRWQGGTLGVANVNSLDVHTFTIIKTSATPTYVLFGSITKYA